ncbi:MAG: hypothetical protein JWO15_3849 [Sphingomonadales bacterium]|nr:hypothetical protein [Sphingomonadales bacterium]
MPEVKKPQDRKAKATPAPTGFTFEEDGKTYSLPSAKDHAGDVPGRVTKAAIQHPDDQQVQLALILAMLDAADIPDDVREVVEDMSTARMFEVLGEWMGESSGSSD